MVCARHPRRLCVRVRAYLSGVAREAYEWRQREEKMEKREENEEHKHRHRDNDVVMHAHEEKVALAARGVRVGSRGV